MRFELMTSSLPRKRSTPELHWLFKSGRRGSNPRPSAWKADALPTELLPPFFVLKGHLLRHCFSLASSFTEVNSGAHSLRSLNLPLQSEKPSSYQRGIFSNASSCMCGERRIRTSEGVRQQIYSLPQLATLVSPHILLWPTELYRQLLFLGLQR